MFGHVAINRESVNERELSRYDSIYCGLCREIKTEYGQLPRLSLSYDLAFLAMVLGSLYEPGERVAQGKCVLQPTKEKSFVGHTYIEYAADLNVMLTYHKCLDDWSDDKNVVSRTYGALLKSSYEKACAKRGHQKHLIESALLEVNQLESSDKALPDDAALRFGELLGELFALEQDHWAYTLRDFGKNLGSFVYLLDAAIDYKEDVKKGNFNPFTNASVSPENMQTLLQTLMGQTTEAFEKLPLVSDIHLMRSILYSGVWQQFYLAYPELLPEAQVEQGQDKPITTVPQPRKAVAAHE